MGRCFVCLGGGAVLSSFPIGMTFLNEMGEVLNAHFILKNYYTLTLFNISHVSRKILLGCVLDDLQKNLCV